MLMVGDWQKKDGAISSEGREAGVQEVGLIVRRCLIYWYNGKLPVLNKFVNTKLGIEVAPIWRLQCIQKEIAQVAELFLHLSIMSALWLSIMTTPGQKCPQYF